VQRNEPPRQAKAPTIYMSYGRPSFVMLFVLVILAPALHLRAQQPASSSPIIPSPLTAEQVVRGLLQMNLRRAEALHSYEGSRTYHVDYRGFPGSRTAAMDVRVKFISPNSKDFNVQSSSGSNLIIDKVLKKLLEAEKEALTAENMRRSALTEENYSFTLVGYQAGTIGAMYVLDVEPRTKDKFLYRGRIWVDAQDFAVVRMQVTPAKNPSFWTKSTQIEQVYQKVGNFWLPSSNKSVTSIRLGGRAELTILYTDYTITRASKIHNLAAQSVEGQLGAGR